MDKNDREVQYDLLRIISSYAVVLLHVSVIWVDAKISLNRFGYLYDDNYLFSCISHAITRFAVPCFIMLAGAFAISNKKNVEYKYYYKKQFFSLFIPTIFISLFYFIWVTISSLLHGDTNRIVSLIKGLLKGEPYYHLWYLYMMIGLYLIVPIIIMFKNSISTKSYLTVAMVYLLMTCISGATSEHKLKWDIGFSMLFLGYFMIGDVIKNHVKKNQCLGIFGLFIGGGLLILCGFLMYRDVHLPGNISLIDPLSPIIVFASVMIFYGFSCIKTNIKRVTLARYSFGIYLWHPFVIDILYKLKLINGEKDNRVMIVGYSLLVFGLSLLLSAISHAFYSKVKEKIMR